MVVPEMPGERAAIDGLSRARPCAGGRAVVGDVREAGAEGGDDGIGGGGPEGIGASDVDVGSLRRGGEGRGGDAAEKDFEFHVDDGVKGFSLRLVLWVCLRCSYSE